jgi:hypothetical protein
VAKSPPNIACDCKNTAALSFFSGRQDLPDTRKDMPQQIENVSV